MIIGLGIGIPFIHNYANLASVQAFSPADLFANGEPGAWYDPGDLTTLYQDAAGTTPVTAVEQPVGLMLDKWGRGNHAFQTTATSRPVLKQDAGGQYYLRADGIDDGMVTGTITPGTDKAQVFAGLRKSAGASLAALLEIGTSTGTNGSFGVYAPRRVGVVLDDYGSISRGTSAVDLNTEDAGHTSPHTAVLGVLADISLPRLGVRVNGAESVFSTANQGTGNFLAYPLYLFRRGGTALPFNGHFYGGIIRFGPNLPIETIQQTEAWMANKTGVTL